jgi:hypothetical protein
MQLPTPTNLTGRGQDDGSWALRRRADSIDHPRMASSCALPPGRRNSRNMSNEAKGGSAQWSWASECEGSG